MLETRHWEVSLRDHANINTCWYLVAKPLCQESTVATLQSPTDYSIAEAGRLFDQANVRAKSRPGCPFRACGLKSKLGQPPWHCLCVMQALGCQWPAGS